MAPVVFPVYPDQPDHQDRPALKESTVSTEMSENRDPMVRQVTRVTLESKVSPAWPDKRDAKGPTVHLENKEPRAQSVFPVMLSSTSTIPISLSR